MAEKISVCIISYNEENKIEECLQSVLDFADEIVVVDSFSEDSTVEIAKKYTDKIINQKFLGYVKQKNYAIEKASNEWIFSIDCDERVSNELGEQILQWKNDDYKGKKNIGFRVNRKTFYVINWICHSNWYPDSKIRLFNKNNCKWVGESIHESILANGAIGTLKGDLLHYSFDTISDHIKTIDSFTSIGALEAYNKGKKSGPLTILLHAVGIFVKMYILKRGFLDGMPGFIAAGLSFCHVFTKYSKLYILNKTGGKESKSPTYRINKR